jgi:hypothetical protein
MRYLGTGSGGGGLDDWGGDGCGGGGGVIVKDLGRMQIVLWGWSLGANVTNFGVCRVTVPVLK